ncbi:amidohydrolase family protein [Microbacterium sp. 18062]|uniref:amidohydrolase family protein n=1 Tax=Microbacterium sp. 18062 TaxID=2681410 RepID=UPI00135713A8|nr:amidohydrolase family protein [Microbacterium sp. 18062]
MTTVAAIDIHAHLVPALTADEVAGTGIRVVDGEVQDAAGHRLGPPQISRVEALVAWLDEAGLAGAAVSIPPPLYRQRLDADAAARWVRAVNTALVRDLTPQPRLVPLGYLPLEHPDIAIAEAARLADDPRVVGVTAAAGARSAALDDPALGPLWHALAEADLALLLHPGQSPDDRLEAHYLHNLLGNPVESGVAAGQLLFGGVFDRVPGLRVGLVHCGGVLPAVAGRWRHGVRTQRPGVAIDADALERGIRSLWIDTLGHDPVVLGHAAGIVGADHVMLGSDWPFPMGSVDPLADVAGLPPAAAEAAAAGAARFLGSRLRPDPSRRPG